MSDNFENNFENEQEMSMEAAEEAVQDTMTEAEDDVQEFEAVATEEPEFEEPALATDSWDTEEDEQDDVQDDEMDKVFREIEAENDENATVDFDKEFIEMQTEIPSASHKGIVGLVFAIILIAAAAFFGIKFFGGNHADLGAGNISNMSFMTASGAYTYYVEPSTYALCRFENTPSSAEMATTNPEANPALFLTDIEGALYYVSMQNGSFMRYVDGVNDEIVISDQCYYPTYINGTLYYLSLSDYFVYAMPYKNGTFGEKTPVIESEAYYLNIYENMLYYIGASDSMLYAVPLDGSMDPVQVSLSQMSYINIADGYIYFMRYPDEAATVTPALCRIPVTDYSVEEVIIDNSYCIYNNYYDGYIYYMSYTPAEGEEAEQTQVYPLFRVKADGSAAPEQVSPDQALYIQIVKGYVYYLTLSDNDVAVWKRLPLGAVDADGTQAEVLPGQELLPLTDEPFALEDLLGEENTDGTEADVSDEIAEQSVETEE